MEGQSLVQVDQKIRISYLDALKGFSILCVVVGHVAEGYLDVGAYPESSGLLYNIFNLIYAFHMPLFMMISGYLYYTAYFDDKGKPDRKRIYHQMCNLVAVYVIFSVAFILFHILSDIFIKKAAHSDLTLLNIVLIWVQPISVYWYLYTLTLFYLIFSIKQLTEVNRWVLLSIFIATAICGQIVSIPWFTASKTLYHALFFFIGIAGKKYKNWIIGNKQITLVIFLVAVGMGVLVWNKERDTSKYANRIFILSIVVALGVSLALWYIFEHINFIGNRRILRLCGKYSLEIYVIHIFFVFGFRMVFLKANLYNVYISAVLNLFISTTAPVLFSILCKKLKIHGLFFKPATYLRRN